MTENTLASDEAQGAEAVVSDAPEKAATDVAEEKARVDAPADAEDGEKDHSGDEKRPNRRTAQERIAQLTRRLRESEEEKARLKEQIAKPPRQEDFGDDYDAYERARVRHAAKEALAEERNEVAQSYSAQIEQAMRDEWRDNAAAFKANAPDFDARIASLPAEFIDPLANTIMALGEDGPAVAYHLASNPHEAHRLSSLPPYAAAAEIGRMSMRIKSPPRRAVSSAPPPASPVVGAGGPTSKDPSQMSYAEYRAWRAGK